MTRDQQEFFSSPFARVRQLKARRKYDEAMALLTQLLEDNPADGRAKASLADLLFRVGKNRQAMKLAGELLVEDPADPRALVVVGNVLLQQGQAQEALVQFEAALEVAASDYLWLRIAACRLALADQAGLGAALDAASRLAPRSLEWYRLRLAIEVAKGDSLAQRSMLAEAAELAPQSPQGFAKAMEPLLEVLPGRKAAQQSAWLRQRPGQEVNARLLLFEARRLQAQRDSAAAQSRLLLIDKADLSPEEARELGRISDRLARVPRKPES